MLPLTLRTFYVAILAFIGHPNFHKFYVAIQALVKTKMQEMLSPPPFLNPTLPNIDDWLRQRAESERKTC
jgi:hypothetical protein